MTAEEWRPVAGYPGYLVSDRGRILSTQPWRGQARRELRGAPTQKSYRTVQLCRAGEPPKRYLVHVLVAEAFLGPRPADKPHTRHLDGNQQNNDIRNLAFGTASENAYDRVQHGTHNMASRTHCPSGHEYTPENTYHLPRRRNRQCRACRAERSRSHKEVLKQQRRAARAAGITASAA